MKWSILLTYATVTLAASKAKFSPSYMISVPGSTNNFAFSLHKTLPDKGNLVFSPWSIAFSLGMVMLGAGGGTLQEMMKTLHFDQLDPETVHYNFGKLREHILRHSEDFDMSMFSTVLIDEDFRVSPVYKLQLQRYYDAHIHEVAFSNLGELLKDWVNSWTALKTGGKIKNIMPTVPDPDTVMLLLTANYFKGVWEHPFDRNRTRSAHFANDDGQRSTIDMMYITRNMSIYTGYDFAVDAVEVPMKGDISFLFMMPESHNELQILQRNLSAEFLDVILSGMTENPVELGIPKFKASSRKELQQPLREMGMKSLFSPLDADLSKISTTEGVSVQEVLHKATLEVDEEGATATAITVISVVSRIKVQKLHFDRPFIFMIRDNISGLILFMGRVSEL